MGCNIKSALLIGFSGLSANLLTELVALQFIPPFLLLRIGQTHVSSVETPLTAVRAFSGIYLHSGRLEKPPPLPPPSAENWPKKLACIGPEAARYMHTPHRRGSARANVLQNKASEKTAFTNLFMLFTSSSSARPSLLTARFVSITCILETVT